MRAPRKVGRPPRGRRRRKSAEAMRCIPAFAMRARDRLGSGHGTTTLHAAPDPHRRGAGAPGPAAGRRARFRRGPAVPLRPGARRLPARRRTTRLALDLLVGVERQKARFVENLHPLRRRPALQPRPALGRARRGQELAGQGRLHGRGRRARRPAAGRDRPRRDRRPARACSSGCAAAPSGSWCCATTCRSRRARRRPSR